MKTKKTSSYDSKIVKPKRRDKIKKQMTNVPTRDCFKDDECCDKLIGSGPTCCDKESAWLASSYADSCKEANTMVPGAGDVVSAHNPNPIQPEMTVPSATTGSVEFVGKTPVSPQAMTGSAPEHSRTAHNFSQGLGCCAEIPGKSRKSRHESARRERSRKSVDAPKAAGSSCSPSRNGRTYADTARMENGNAPDNIRAHLLPAMCSLGASEKDAGTKTDEPSVSRRQSTEAQAEHGNRRMAQPAASPEQRKVPLIPNLPVLTLDLLKRICNRSSLDRAWEQVLRKDGVLREALNLSQEQPKGKRLNRLARPAKRKAKGVDRQSTLEAYQQYAQNPDWLLCRLQDGSYRPSPVKRVNIPKPSGGTRPLGIPTVRDRVVQAVILAVLQPLVDPWFASFSHGFRPEHSVYTAAMDISRQIQNGATYAIDFDLSKYFDTVDHGILLDLLRRMGVDGKLLRLLNKYLRATIVHPDGTKEKPTMGTPQGGVVSPLLANLYLHRLDQELAIRNLPAVRYADDFTVFANSRRAAGRILRGISAFVEKELHLKVNLTKTKIVPVRDLEFLGFSFRDGIGLTDETVKTFRTTICQLTRTGTKRQMGNRFYRLRKWLNGWFAHYGQIEVHDQITALSAWFAELIRQREQERYPPWYEVYCLWKKCIRDRDVWKQALPPLRSLATPSVSRPQVDSLAQV